jgi:hypothetical protein
MGFVQSMVLSLKFNKRDRKSALKRLKENPAEYSEGGELHFEKKATPTQLHKIREDLKRVNRKAFIRKGIIIGIILVLFIYFIGFAKF